MSHNRKEMDRSHIPPVTNDENIARALFDPSFYHEGQLATRAFELRTMMSKDGTMLHEKYISVFRESMCNVKDVALSIPPRKDEIPIGYASMLTESVQSISSPVKNHTIELKVKSEPTRITSAHAGIYTKIDDIKIKGKTENGHPNPLISYVQGQLVSISKVKLFT